MEYNPYIQKCNDLSNMKTRLIEETKWFDSTDIGILLSSLEEKETMKIEHKSLFSKNEKEIQLLSENIQGTKQYIKSIFNPFNWFDDEQKTYRKKLNRLKKELIVSNDNKDKTLKKLSTTNSKISTINSEVKKYDGFNIEKTCDKINRLDAEIVELERKLRVFYGLQSNVDNALRPILSQIKDYESSISTANTVIVKAKSFDRKLDVADNSYERSMIHEECEKYFDVGSPKKIINQEERKIRQYERDLIKSKKRAVEISRKASREINKIIIDGNNLCYEGGGFVGLNPLLTVTRELFSQYHVVVVFDASIRSKIKANDNKIRSYFNRNIEIHVVATKQLADETILDIASHDDVCYILSNDRFGEYKDKEVVHNNRVIRHEIVSGKVIIHDLNINSIYDS